MIQPRTNADPVKVTIKFAPEIDCNDVSFMLQWDARREELVKP